MPRTTRRNGTAFEPTAEQRKFVEQMAAVGIAQDDIAVVLDMTPKTLRKRFRTELDKGAIKANAAVGGALYTAATTKGPGQVTAGIWWTKTRMGWKETVKQEHTGANGEPLFEVRRIERVIIRRGEKAAEKEAARPKADRAKDARPPARPIHTADRNA